MSTVQAARTGEIGSFGMRATNEILASLERSRAAMEAFVNDMVDACFLVTTDGRCVWGNRAAAGLLAVDPESIHQHSLGKLFTTAAWRRFYPWLSQVAGGTDQPQTLELPLGEGTLQREFSWQVRPFRGVDDPRGQLLMVVGRDVTTLLLERTQKVRLETELETARLVQGTFFPPLTVGLPDLKIASYYEPANRCSGDWWGRFNLGPGLELICIGDVTGHGAGAALVTAMIHSCCAMLTTLIHAGDHGLISSPSHVVSRLNEILCDAMKQTLAMSFLALLFDLKAGVIRFSNAGHHLPLVFPASRTPEVEKARIGQLTRFARPGDPLGMTPGFVYDEGRMQLSPGDRVVLFTDGIIESSNQAGVQWGKRRFVQSLTANLSGDAVQLLGASAAAAKAHFGKMPPEDDITLVAVEVSATWRPTATASADAAR